MPKVYYPGEEPVPGYRLARFLGRGSIGEVWKAEGQGGLETALKLANLESRPGIRDLHVLLFLKKVRHPQLVPLLAYWLKNDEGKLLTENTFDLTTKQLTPATRPTEMILALGLGEKNLRDRLADCQSQQLGGIPTEELLGYLTDAAKGIDFLNQPIHDLGQGAPEPVRHCNIKPQNLILVGNSVQIADYGLAHLLDAHLSTITAFSLTYVAPEVLKDNKPGPHTDQYALAITYYELRTGLATCSSKMMLDIYTQKLQGKLDFSQVPDREQEVLRRATAIDPGKRFASASAFAEEMRRAVAPAPLAVSPASPENMKTAPLGEEKKTAPVAEAAKTTKPAAEETKGGPKPSSSQHGPEIVPGYKLLHMLGRGGYGEVWSATAPGGMKVAVKIIRNLDNDDTGQQEFRALELIKGISHNHLLELHAAWLLDREGHVIDDEEFSRPRPRLAATLVIACRLAQKSLGQRLKECLAAGQTGIPLAELLPFLMQAAQAIDYLNMPVHQFGNRVVAVQHRDIKPENLLLVDQHTVKVADFGLAKILENAAGTVQTSAPTMTLAYAAPELFEGQVSPHTDQYSLAITWFQLRTGHLPFPPVKTQQQYILLHMNGKLDFQRVSPEEEAVLRKATARQPADRFPTCIRFAQSLGQAVGIPVHVPTSGTTVPPSGAAKTPSLGLHPFATEFPSLSSADIYARDPQVPATPTDRLLDTHLSGEQTLAKQNPTAPAAPPQTPTVAEKEPRRQPSATEPLLSVSSPHPFAHTLPIIEEEQEVLYEETVAPRTMAPVVPAPQRQTWPQPAPFADDLVPLPADMPRGKTGLLVAVALCFFLGAGGGVGAWWYLQQNKDTGGSQAKTDPTPPVASTRATESARATPSAMERTQPTPTKAAIVPTPQKTAVAPKPFDPAQWQQALLACDQGDYQRCKEMCRELKAAAALPAHMPPLIQALEVECSLLSNSAADLAKEAVELRQHQGGYVQYVTALVENAAGKSVDAAKVLTEVDPKTPELSPRRRERGRDVYVQCVRNIKRTPNEWLSPYASTEEAAQAHSWSTKAGEWNPAGALPLEIRLARTLASWHQARPDAGLTVTLTGALLQAEKLELVDRCALLYARAQAAAQLGSVEGVQRAVEAYAQLREGLRQDRSLQPDARTYTEKVLQPALRLQSRLQGEPASWPQAVRTALAGLHAELGRVILENPYLEMKGQNLGQLAVDSFGAAIKLVPTEAAYHAGRAWAQSSERLPQSDYAAMERDAQEALKRDDKLPLAYWAMGFVQHKRAQQAPQRTQRLQLLRLAINWYSQAIDAVRKLPEQDGELARYLIARSAAYILAANWDDSPLDARKQMLEKARADADAATQANPRYPEYALEALGYALEDLAEQDPQREGRRFSEANAKFTEALQHRNTAKYLMARGRSRTKAVLKKAAPPAQLANALSDFQQALRLEPQPREEAEIQHWLALIHQHPSRKEYDQAEACLARAVSLLEKREPRDWVVLTQIWAEFAFQAAQRRYQENPQEAEVLRWLGRAWERAERIRTSPYSEAQGAVAILRETAHLEVDYHLAAARRAQQRSDAKAASTAVEQALATVRRMRTVQLPVEFVAVQEGRTLRAARRPKEAQQAYEPFLPKEVQRANQKDMPLLIGWCGLWLEYYKDLGGWNTERLQQLVDIAQQLRRLTSDPEQTAAAFGIEGEAWDQFSRLETTAQEDIPRICKNCRDALRQAVKHYNVNGWYWRRRLAEQIDYQVTAEKIEGGQRRQLLTEAVALLKEAERGHLSETPAAAEKARLQRRRLELENKLNQ